MHDLFTVTLETEMPGLDYPGMHRSDRHLMDLFPFHLIELHLADPGMPVRVSAPDILLTGPDTVKTHRFEPGMIDRIKADPAFAAVRDALDQVLDPANFVGRAPEQVTAYLAQHVDPALARFKDPARGQIEAVTV